MGRGSSIGVDGARVQRINDAIRVIPDFPKPGIQFQDVTTILLDPEAFKHTIDLLAERYQGRQVDVVAGAAAPVAAASWQQPAPPGLCSFCCGAAAAAGTITRAPGRPTRFLCRRFRGARPYLRRAPCHRARLRVCAAAQARQAPW